jgi:phosphinothricin acetyltransferase
MRLFAVLADLGYYQAIAGITLPNAPSVALHEAMGFVPVTAYRNVGFKLGHWRDVGYWQKPLRELTPPSGPPRPFMGG